MNVLSPPRHLLTLWNPSYAADAMDAHLRLLLDWSGKHQRQEATEDDVYVWWGKIRSKNRSQALPHAADVLALEEQIKDDIETQLYLTDYRSLYVAHLDEIADGRMLEEYPDEVDHMPDYYNGELIDFWFRIADVRKLADDTLGTIEALKRLRNTRYHDRPVSLYGGMMDLPLIVTCEAATQWFTGMDALREGKLWAEHDASLVSETERIARELRDNLLGRDVWFALHPATRTFLAAGEAVFRARREDPAFDFSGPVVEYAKAVETELNALLFPALRRVIANLNPAEREVQVDGRLIDLGGHVPHQTIGTIKTLLERNDTIKKYAKVALPQDANTLITQIPAHLAPVAKHRNPAAHDEIVPRESANEIRDEVLGIGREGLIVMLARMKLRAGVVRILIVVASLALLIMQDYPSWPMSPDLQIRIGLRLKTIREALGLSQTEVTQKFEFKDRQTLSAIESGSRRIAPEELARAAEIFRVPVDYFTDAFRLEGEGEFSFRVADVDTRVIEAFEEQAGRWVATYRELSAQEGQRLSHLSVRLELTSSSAYEDAWSAADELRGAWRLGETPARELQAAIQREIGALVLHVDAPHGISGAATRLPGLNTILINRQEPVGRRNFDLAHELFHILTWEAMKPDRVEPLELKPVKGNRVEYLAENFAAALLIPGDAVGELWKNRDEVDIHDWLIGTATRFHVSAAALKWRMKNLGHLSPSEVAAIDESRLVANGGTLSDIAPPPLFNADFVRRVHVAIESGRLSLRRAAKLLGLKISDLADVCRQYGLPLSYEG